MGELDDLFATAEKDLADAPARFALEAERQRKAIEAAEAAGWYAFKWSSPKHAGVLDVIFMRFPKRIVFIEFKIPGKEPTALQEACMDTLFKCDFPFYVCHDAAETLAALANH
jgi:hypothetical protein